MDDNERERLLHCLGVAQMVEVIAYAEVRALIAAGLGAAVEPPDVLARAALAAMLQRECPLRGMLAGPSCTIVVDQLRSHVRAATSLAMKNRARERGLGAPLSPVQLGSLDGIERIAHQAGEQAAPIREGDLAIIGKASELAGLALYRLRR